MAIISGVVKKGEDPVEGAKVYILYDGEVVASAETSETGEYLCDGLDDDKKYHAVVEHSEVDGEEVTHYSARSMPGITPAEDPRIFLYKDGEGEENWNLKGVYSYHGSEFKSDHVYIWVTTDSDDGYSSYMQTKNKVDVTAINYMCIEYKNVGFSGYRQTIGFSHMDPPLNTPFQFSNDKIVYKLDVSSETGEKNIAVVLDSYDHSDIETAELFVYKIWLE